jgi:glycosyltransferase involved in cell wall biosynthesis
VSSQALPLGREPPSKSVLLLDISRLIWRARRRGPSGIDRVELAYAEHFIAAQGDRPAYAVLHLFGFLFAVSPIGGRRFIEDLAARWQGTPRHENLATVLKMYLRLVTGGWILGPWLRRRLRAPPGSPIFLVVSHHHLSRGYTLERIRRSSLGMKTACLIHDLLPLDYPEYFKRGWEQRYRLLTSTIGRCFDAVIANSESTARALRTRLQEECEGPSLPVAVRVAPPGVRAFHRAQIDTSSTQGGPCFVVLGTIEPRKNHLLLLNLWTRLAAAMPVPPRLLVIGARGWENEQVVDMLERSRRLHGLVEEHSGLADDEVGALLGQARALLLPSIAEGYGLPLAEALASGVPAICSDIAPLREVGGDVPEYLDPLDVRAWMDAVLDYSRPDSTRRAAQLQRLAQWHAPCWADHFTTVEQMLGELDCDQAAPSPAAPRAALRAEIS